jgi:hypothetical protein
MKSFAKLLSSLFDDSNTHNTISAFERDWHKYRSEALTPSHRAEIDEIFARHS